MTINYNKDLNKPLLDDEEFIAYELDYNGKRIKLDIKPEELQNYLTPERVLIIVRITGTKIVHLVLKIALNILFCRRFLN